MVQLSLMNDPALRDFAVIAISEPHAWVREGKVRTSPVAHPYWTKMVPTNRHEGRWAFRSMIWVRSDIEAEQIPIASSDLTAALLTLPDRAILVISVYIAGADEEAHRISTHKLRQAIRETRQRVGTRVDVMLLGDFNRHDQIWGGDDVAPERQGEADPIIDLMSDYHLQSLLPRGTKTWQKGPLSTIIDLVLVSEELAASVLKCDLHETEHGSDHSAIETGFELETIEPWQSYLTSTAKGATWLSYLTALNIIEFRTEIARHLLASNKKHPELSTQMTTAIATQFQQLSYSVDGMRSVFEVGGAPVTPHMATGNKSNITSSWDLIEMLFGWGEETVWKKPRVAWAKKPYCMILRKTFELVERILGTRTADEWLHQFKLVIMVTHWVLPYVTPGSFLPLTKSNRGLGQQARTTWFSTVYVNGGQKKGYRHTATGARWTQREEASTLADATRKTWLRYRMPEGSSSKDLVLMMESSGLRLPNFGGPDTGCFQLGRRQYLTTIYPYWESGIPPQWPGVFSLPDLTIPEFDEYFRQQMDTADNSAPAPAPAVQVTLEPCTPTQSLDSVSFYSSGNRVKVTRQKRYKHGSRFEEQDSALRDMKAPACDTSFDGVGPNVPKYTPTLDNHNFLNLQAILQLYK